MRIIEPSFAFETPLDNVERERCLRLIERAGRKCYKSECGNASEFVRKICQVKKHQSVIEHASASVGFVMDRGVSHELVRHRLAAFSQESTRYCNYSGDKFDNEITVIRPVFFEDTGPEWWTWRAACISAEATYMRLIARGCKPEEARSVLPNSLKTEITMTCNMREWRHVFQMRTAATAHPQMRQLMRPLLAQFITFLPEIFDDITF